MLRTFPKQPLQKENNNLVIGSSIIAKLEDDKSIPADCNIHAHRGSKTNEKLKVLNSHEDKKMKTIIIQDGTNNVLKHGKNASQNFEEHKKLLDKCIEKFDQDVCVCSL